MTDMKHQIFDCKQMNQNTYFCRYFILTIMTKSNFFAILILICGGLAACNRQNSSQESAINNFVKKDVYEVKLILKKVHDEKVAIHKFHKGVEVWVDSLTTDSKGIVSFKLNYGDIGLYRISFRKNYAIDFLFNNEDVCLATNQNNDFDSLKIMSSVENEILYRFYKQFNGFNRRMALLSPLLRDYPDNEKFYTAIKDEYAQILKKDAELMDDIKKSNPQSLAYRYIDFIRKPTLSPMLKPEEAKLFLKGHFFDHKDFSDTALIHSNALTEKILTYLSLYRNENLTQQQQEQEFIQAADTILTKTSRFPLAFTVSLSYLIEGFEKYQYGMVLNFIHQKFYSEISCVNDSLKQHLDSSVNRYNALQVGKPAPNFSLPDATGKLFHLKKNLGEYSILIFWSSTCTFCQKTIRELNQILALNDKHQLIVNQKLKIISISVDTDKAEWLKSNGTGNNLWVNLCDLKGWSSPTVIEYNVFATPTLYILNSDGLIISKPLPENLRDALKSIGLKVSIPI